LNLSSDFLVSKVAFSNSTCHRYTMLPTTFRNELKHEEELKKRLKAKLEVARFLQDTVKVMAKGLKQSRSGGAVQFVNAVDRHSLKAPGFIQPLIAYQMKNRFQSLLFQMGQLAPLRSGYTREKADKLYDFMKKVRSGDATVGGCTSRMQTVVP
jgi:hypothetical protein